jgi:alpha-glucosidase (family GH31 glycosyl hydrolase)
VAEAGRKALALRYRLLPAIYSAMYMVHRHGGTVAKPVFFAAPGGRLGQLQRGTLHVFVRPV